MPGTPTLQSRFRGCLLGGAVGDALGAPVEFMRIDEILQAYGPGGIRDLGEAYGVHGAITDDTQMTLFTAEGIIRQGARSSSIGNYDFYGAIREAYFRWLSTQGRKPSLESSEKDGWLIAERRLHARRAPGSTCLCALESARPDAKDAQAVNDSKGCGGVMRIAPWGLVAEEDVWEKGARIAGITHGHPLGKESAGAMAFLIRQLTLGEPLPKAVGDLLTEAEQRNTELCAILRLAAEKAALGTPPAEEIVSLGEGWVAEEALAIALFCALRAETLEEGVVMAVNHSGDSDSTGSVAGQILGALLGEEAIPPRWTDSLELRDVVERMADDLYTYYREPDSGGDGEWQERYPGR